MIRRIFCFLIIMMTSAFVSRAEHYYRLYLKDKPDSFLCNFSDRAEMRRSFQYIEYDSTDFVVSPLYLDMLRSENLKVVVTSRWLNAAVVCSLNGEKIEDDFWTRFDFVDSVKCVQNDIRPEKKLRRKMTIVKDEPRTRSLKDNCLIPHREIGLNVLHEAGFRGDGKLIAVLDGGFKNVDVLQSINKNVIGWHDMYSPDEDEYMLSEEPHGTQCLSILSADGSKDLYGAAPESMYYLIRSENSLSESPLEEDMWVAAAEFADSIGADIISSSLGYLTFDDESMDHSQDELAKGIVFISRGAEIATRKGMLVCVAAGNERQTDWGALDFPADVENVLTVGASNKDLIPAFFSSPGFLFPYVKPDMICRGEKAFFVDCETEGVCTGNGTSYATPLMAGACASLWSSMPKLSSLELLEIVRKSARSHSCPDSLGGRGLADIGLALGYLFEYNSIGNVEEKVEIECSSIFDLEGKILVKKQFGYFTVKNKKLLFVKER